MGYLYYGFNMEPERRIRTSKPSSVILSHFLEVAGIFFLYTVGLIALIVPIVWLTLSVSPTPYANPQDMEFILEDSPVMQLPPNFQLPPPPLVVQPAPLPDGLWFI